MYVTANFVLGSVDTLGLLWSMSHWILYNFRKRCTLVLTEMIFFLKANGEYWNVALISEDVSKSLSDRWSARLASNAE